MKAKRHGKPPATGVAFWDTSAIVPLCFFQRQSAQANQTLRSYRKQITWWATAVEAVSALNRLTRERVMSGEARQQALARLNILRNLWDGIQPSADLRDTAERLLGVHKLRASDALQLSAALVMVPASPAGPHVHCGG
jgi:predicted nucleic acid-binding protein